MGESFPFARDAQYWYLRQNHNSVLGIREYALEHGATFHTFFEAQVESMLKLATNGNLSDTIPKDDFVDAPPVSLFMDQVQTREQKSHCQSNYHLFSFPAEENFAGVKV